MRNVMNVIPFYDFFSNAKRALNVDEFASTLFSSSFSQTVFSVVGGSGEPYFWGKNTAFYWQQTRDFFIQINHCQLLRIPLQWYASIYSCSVFMELAPNPISVLSSTQPAEVFTATSFSKLNILKAKLLSMHRANAKERTKCNAIATPSTFKVRSSQFISLFLHFLHHRSICTVALSLLPLHTAHSRLI